MTAIRGMGSGSAASLQHKEQQVLRTTILAGRHMPAGPEPDLFVPPGGVVVHIGPVQANVNQTSAIETTVVHTKRTWYGQLKAAVSSKFVLLFLKDTCSR